jgi:hypothetical protein
MFKRLFWIAIAGALLAAAYVQETGRSIPYVSGPAAACARGAEALWFRCFGKPAPTKPEKPAKPAERRDGRQVAQVATPRAAPAQPPRQPTSQGLSTSGSLTKGSGTVVQMLPDDNDGSRHQKFIVRLDSGRRLLVAHNIDIAPRIGNLRVGDAVSFCGEYEPNSKGGVIHWTHHDPNGRHAAGWLQHNGRMYQ